MKPALSIPKRTRAEQETEAEASRLIKQIEGALTAMTIRSSDEADSLDVAADRIERASRDFAVALRDLSRERRRALNEPW
jgi:hypothetical protein